MAARKPQDRTDVDLILEEISKRLKRIEQTTDKTLRTSARQGKIDTAPVGIRAALKQKMIRGIFGNYIGSAIIRKGEKKRMDRELAMEREDDLQHQRDLEDIKQTSQSNTFSKDIGEKLENLMLASQKMSKTMSDMNENLIRVSTIIVAIQKRVSPRDVNIGENKKIRYDPLAPSGFQYSEVTRSGKSGKIAKKSDANRAAFSAARQMAKESSKNSYELKPSSEEYSEEKKDIEESEKIDIPTEDINAKRYEKIQETLDEIKEKMEDGGFFSGLLKTIATLGAGIIGTLMSKLASISGIVGAIAGRLGIGILSKAGKAIGGAVSSVLAKRAAGQAAKAAAKAAATGAAATGAAVVADAAADASKKPIPTTGETPAAKGVPDKTPPKTAPSSSSSKISTKWKLFLKFLEKKSPSLFTKFMTRIGPALVGLAIPGPGWVWTAVGLGLNVWTAWEIYKLYQEFSGGIQETEDLMMDDPSEEEFEDEFGVGTPVQIPSDTSSQLFAASSPEEQEAEGAELIKGVFKEAEKVKVTFSSGLDPSVTGVTSYDPETGKKLNVESIELHRNRTERVLQPIVIPQETRQQQQSRGGNEQASTTNVTVKSRNSDPTLATYRASIFDHPVTHPGNFMV